ncbi:MAG: UDP-glucose 4-epimerase GalE [Desulfotomaculales bacterium]
MRLMVTGGAGYIGSHTVRILRARGWDVVVYDDLSTGHSSAVPPDVPLIVGDVGDAPRVSAALREYDVQAVLHFAALSLVGESMENPRRYFERNVGGGLALLGAMLENGVRYFVLSSTAAVYGEPEVVPIPEDHPLRPTNPYGDAKAFLETVLRRYEAAYGLRWMALRYFNAAGAHPDGDLGEDHRPETHLIPVVLQAALGQREAVVIFGNDYPTPDGTAVRDYIHVQDLAEAHVLALEGLLAGMPCTSYNLGIGRGYSVKEVITAAREVTGREIPVRVGPRRPGDPAVLVASAARIRRELGWYPRYERLEDIIATAWTWHRQHPLGFGGREERPAPAGRRAARPRRPRAGGGMRHA